MPERNRTLPGNERADDSTPVHPNRLRFPCSPISVPSLPLVYYPFGGLAVTWWRCEVTVYDLPRWHLLCELPLVQLSPVIPIVVPDNSAAFTYPSPGLVLYKRREIRKSRAGLTSWKSSPGPVSVGLCSGTVGVCPQLLVTITHPPCAETSPSFTLWPPAYCPSDSIAGQ